MNNLLYLKGKFEHAKNSNNNFGAPKLPANASVDVGKVQYLINCLKRESAYWKEQHILFGALIEVHYCKIVAKSNRITELLTDYGQGVKKTPNETIVGARFSDDGKHIITHYISKEALLKTADKLSKIVPILENEFDGCADTGLFNEDTYHQTINYDGKYGLSKSVFRKIIVDCYYVDSFQTLLSRERVTEPVVATLYKTEIDRNQLSNLLPDNRNMLNALDGTTYGLSADQYNILIDKAPYLIAMDMIDLSVIELNDLGKETYESSIGEPTNEPWIGVIDTPFDNRVYFHKWVEYEDKTNPLDGKPDRNDYLHGTEIDSILVDGPSINPWLDDNCGHFRVKHFGVTVGGKIRSFELTKKIEEIVVAHPEIHVWNLSLGSTYEISKNFVSLQGALLDRLQNERNVIFVVAGTNGNRALERGMKIGAPADSLNSIVVNSVDENGNNTPYTRRGPVLSFFNKPDVSFFGGDFNKPMRTCNALGEQLTMGTSFAAPWIARKLAYLIDVLNLPREVAKALIIDSAVSWDYPNKTKEKIQVSGYGIVPKTINEIVETPEDEIKFVIFNSAKEYTTYNYNLPVPMENNKYPFRVRATMAYFPKCDRNQGIDYTCTELSLNFGRIKDDKIKTINSNTQDSEGFVGESEARSDFRKWDNVKHISQGFGNGNRLSSLKSYQNKNWGISVVSKERLSSRQQAELNFGIVVTLKEINGINRIEKFISQCFLSGWLVQQIVVQNRIDVYNEAQNDINFED